MKSLFLIGFLSVILSFLCIGHVQGMPRGEKNKSSDTARQDSPPSGPVSSVPDSHDMNRAQLPYFSSTELSLPLLPQSPATISESHAKFAFALRTNLLLDLVGGANIGIEIPVGNHFSVAGDFAYAYTRINNLYALQTIQGTLEGRYWLNRCENYLTGWNIGVYATYCSRFDIQWKSGYQGDGYWSVGISGGYAVQISDRFNLDFSLLGGYFYSPEVRSYDKPRDGHLMWRETTYNMNRILLTQVRVNLVWLLKTHKKARK